jgi:hypothetical protein
VRSRSPAALAWTILGVTLIAGALLAACGPPAISLSQLVDHQEQYDGRTLTTSGSVRHFTDGGGYDVVEDATGNRVLIRPGSAVSGYVGRSVTVTGRFSIDPSVGRVISVDSVRSSPR